MDNAIKDYKDALGRLKRNKPVRVPKGTKISNDSVALEAGRSKGSIKKSRPGFSQLLIEIELAKVEQARLKNPIDDSLNKLKSERDKYRRMYEEGIAREISLAQENLDLKRQVLSASQSNVVPLTVIR